VRPYHSPTKATSIVAHSCPEVAPPLLFIMQYSLEPAKHTLSPIVTGATTIGIKYKDGVMVAADTLASYGNQARYKDMCRMKKVGEYSLLGASGEMSDFQYMGEQLDEMANEDWLNEDGCSMGPKAYASYINRVMYNRRSKMNPLYNQFVIVGKKKEEAPFLAFCDHQGTYFEEDFVATGFGTYLAMPILRNEWKADMSEEEAKKMMMKCLQVCFYRDCRAYYKIQIGTCTGTEVKISEPMELDHFWGYEMWTEKRLEPGCGKGVQDTW